MKELVVTLEDGSIEYTLDDIFLHRLDGPAVERPDGKQYWHIHLPFMKTLSTEELCEWIICYSHNFPPGIIDKVKEIIELKTKACL